MAGRYPILKPLFAGHQLCMAGYHFVSPERDETIIMDQESFASYYGFHQSSCNFDGRLLFRSLARHIKPPDLILPDLRYKTGARLLLLIFGRSAAIKEN